MFGINDPGYINSTLLINVIDSFFRWRILEHSPSVFFNQSPTFSCKMISFAQFTQSTKTSRLS